MGKALDAEERLHVCFTINASIISVKHFTCDLFHFRYLFKMRCNSLKFVIIFVVRKQVLCHYFNELSFFVVYKDYVNKPSDLDDLTDAVISIAPIITYQNMQGEARYLIPVEVTLAIEGRIETSHATRGTLELYLFKKFVDMMLLFTK